VTDGRILLVDDHAPNLVTLEAVLRPLGHRLVSVHRGLRHCAGLIEMQPLPPGTTIRLESGMPVALVQRQLLERVFANLISNAVKYCRRPDAHIRLAYLEADQFFEFSVSDNGPGNEPRYHERIWNLFQRLESQDDVEGTGVGLALVKKIVDGQGWARLGRVATGQRCIVSLPVAARAARQHHPRLTQAVRIG